IPTPLLPSATLFRSRMGDAVAFGRRQHGAVTILTELGRRGEGDLRVEFVPLHSGQRRAADLIASSVVERNLLIRQIEFFGTFHHCLKAERSARIDVLRRNRQAQSDRKENGFRTGLGWSLHLANTLNWLIPNG